MRKIYMVHSFVQAPKDFIEKIEGIKMELRKEYEVLSSIIPAESNPIDFYKESIQKCLPRSDILVALCDYSALGLGYEIGVALEKYSKPTLVLVADGVDISDFVVGIDHPMYTFKRYKTVEDIISFIKEKELKHFKTAVPVEVCGTDVCAV